MRAFLLIFLGIVPLVASGRTPIPGSADAADERDTLQEARVFHILLNDASAAERYTRELRAFPHQKQFEEFKALAKRVSSDTESAQKGGDLGTLNEASFKDLFGRDLSAMPSKEVFPAIKSSYGWHILYIAETIKHVVGDICRETLQKSISAAAGNTRRHLEFSIKPVDLGTLHQSVSEILGKKWGPPLKDQNGNLAYFSARTSGEQRVVAVHTDFVHALYFPAEAEACVRSEAKEYEIDCKRKAIALIRNVDYEGRAATGKAVRLPFNASSSNKLWWPATGGLFSQILGFGCGNK